MSIFNKTGRKPSPPDPEQERWRAIERTPRPALTSHYAHACWAGLQFLAAWARLAGSTPLFRSGDRHDAGHKVGSFLEAVRLVPKHYIRGALAEVRDLIEDIGDEVRAQGQAEWQLGEPSTAAELAEQLLAAMEGVKGKGLMPEDVDELREMLARRRRAELELEAEHAKLHATDWADPTPELIAKLPDLRDRLLAESKLCYSALAPAEQAIYEVVRNLGSATRKTITEASGYEDGYVEQLLTSMRKRGIVEPIGGGSGTMWRVKDRLPDEPPAISSTRLRLGSR